jgi:hypothetical protein
MSHWFTARPAGIMVHHTTAHSSSTANFTAEPCLGYDFMILASGGFFHGQAGHPARRFNATGCHARGCNCIYTGIAMQGCFGANDSSCQNMGNELPTWDQMCTLAWLWHDIGAPKRFARFRPHRNCFYWNYCGASNPGPTPTDCCGTRLTHPSSADHSWGGGYGVQFAIWVHAMANQWATCGRCTC